MKARAAVTSVFLVCDATGRTWFYGNPRFPALGQPVTENNDICQRLSYFEFGQAALPWDARPCPAQPACPCVGIPRSGRPAMRSLSLETVHCTLISQRTMKTLRLFPPMRSLWGADGTGSSCRKISNCSYRKSSHMWVIMSRFREFPEEWNSTDTVLFFVFPFGSWGTNEEKRGKIIC